MRYLHVSWLCWLGGCAEIRDWERVRRVQWLADGCGCASLLSPLAAFAFGSCGVSLPI